MRGSTVGIDDNLKGTSEAHFIFLTVLDLLLSSLVIAPAVIAYWRGTWNLLELYIFPDSPEWSSLTFFLIGVVGHMTFTLAQRLFTRNFHPEKHRILYYLASRTYSYVYGVVCVSMWEGVWKALEYYSGEEVWITAVVTVIATLTLMGMHNIRNVSAPPFAVFMDICQGYFDIPTMFKVNGKLDPSLYFLDCTFSVVIVGSLVVFVWRGAWYLTDTFLYPEDTVTSAFSSIVLGYAIVILVFLLQSPMKRLCDYLKGFWRIVAVDIYIFLSFIGTINTWRGIWMLLNIFFLPDDVALSNFITHFLPFLLLVLMNCSNSLLVRGVYIDGEEMGGKCVDFPTYYLRMYFQEQRKKKILKQSQKLRISTLANKTEDLVKTEKVYPDIGKGHVTVEVPQITRF